MSRHVLRVACWASVGLLPLLASLSACGAEPLAERSANVVFITERGCDYFIVQSLGRAYAVLARQSDVFEPRQGDVLEGGVLRRGRATLRYLPFEAAPFDREDAPEVSVQVDRPDLSLGAAQTRLREACAAEG